MRSHSFRHPQASAKRPYSLNGLPRATHQSPGSRLSRRTPTPSAFSLTLIAALQTVEASFGTTALALLHAPHPPPPETILMVLTNEITRHAIKDFVLVLDDYHVLTAAPIERAMTFLVEHCPPQLHLLLATRADPPLQLARLRARRQLTELRAAQLQFEAGEAHAFLQTVMGLDLSAQEVAALHSRTEGWIAGLHLAALSLQDRPDVPQFLADLTGSHRHVVDYLVEEVLARQPEDVQSFLVHTSVLRAPLRPFMRCCDRRQRWRSHAHLPGTP